MISQLSARRVRGAAVFVLVLLVIEFLDEFVFGARETALPLIRRDLGLSYEQIGLLLTLPIQFAGIIEIGLGVLADIWKRRILILGGGLVFALALMLVAGSQGFWVILIGHLLLYPASGAFVSLSQSTLMDIEPERHEQNMARWTFAGSLGVTFGSIAIGVLSSAGLSWRGFFVFTAVLALILVLVMRLFPFPVIRGTDEEDDDETVSFQGGLRGVWSSLRRGEVTRWLVLLQCSDLMLDGLHGYLALYFVDVVGTTPVQASLAIVIWTGIGLIGDFLLIPLLERVRGLDYLRWSVRIEFMLFPLFLIASDMNVKLVLLAVIGFFNAGWYSILKGQLYTAMPGQSGTVLALNNIAGFVGGMTPLVIGLIAGRFGLDIAMWIFLLGPIALLVGLSRKSLS